MGPSCETAYSLPAGSLQQYLMDGVAADPAARAAILICSVGAMHSCRPDPLSCASVIGLRSYAIGCVQAAVMDPNTCHSDYTALAIANLGNFEVVFGFEEASRTHLQGVACIRNARGGSLHWVLDGVLAWMAALDASRVRDACLPFMKGQTWELDTSNVTLP